MKLSTVIQSLKFQIVVAIAALTALFAGATLYSLYVIDQQHSDDILVQLAGRLQFNQQHLTVQAMRYDEHAPRDYAAYFRDVKLYYVDLNKTIAELSQLINAFANESFSDDLVGESMPMVPRLTPRSLTVAQELATTWTGFKKQLDEAIGPNLEEPRLEWAAELIVANYADLESISERLLNTLQKDVAQRAARANTVNRLLLALALVVSLLIAIWFYRRVLGPLSIAVNGFRQVANGDFSYRVPIVHNDELGSLASSFNLLTDRLDALRTLLTKLEQGADLDSTLRTLSTSLPALIPVDWIGVLVFGVDGDIHLEKAYSDGHPDRIGALSFYPEGSLMEECIDNREPLHIPDVKGTSALSKDYSFLRRLAELGRRDAVFLPIGIEGVQGVAVFASRYPNNFRSEHLALLGNLGVLLGVSLGRMVQFTESRRLASIGQFASGIVHEIRNPLATVTLAFEHLRTLDTLPPSSTKRIDLASREVARLERLLAEILQYAKPLTLNRKQVDLAVLAEDVIAAERLEGIDVEFAATASPPVWADRDRIRQVLINLFHNAQQASLDGGTVEVRCQPDEAEWTRVEIRNGGEAIPEKILERVFEPFVTTKSNGTGLGLPIVERIIDAHGGDIIIASDAVNGTVVTFRLPTVAAAAPAQVNQAANAGRV